MDIFEHFNVGHIEEFTHVVSMEDVDSFAQLTGDDNPLHMSDEFAQACLFGKRVVHGMLTSSFISTIIGNKLPGPGALWQSQTLHFRNPTYIGDQILVRAELLQKSIGQRTFRLKTEITNQNGDLLVDGEALVKVLKKADKEKKT